MKRNTLSILLAAVLFALAGCGGGGSSLPDPNNPDNGNGGQDNEQFATPIAPESIVGRNTVSIVPGQLNVLSGATAEELDEIVENYGMRVLHQNGAYTTVSYPDTMELAEATSLLEKEYVITSAEPVRRIETARQIYSVDVKSLKERTSSFSPLDPFYGEQIIGFNGADQITGGATFIRTYGQAHAMNRMGFEGAWDVSLSNNVATQPVRIAIIDAGWQDYSLIDRPGLDETSLDALASGSVDGTGTFVPGLAAATFETETIDVDDTAAELWVTFPIRNDGEIMLGMLAATINDFRPFAVDVNGVDGLELGEVWNEGTAGINPTAQYILIKTGTNNAGAWSFTDNEIAASIDHAVASNADVILLGMFAPGTVSANISTAVQAARDAGAVVVAPAGDVMDSFNGTTFDDPVLDITVDPVSPASDPNVLSVTGTGLERIGDLPDLDFDPPGPGPEDVPNPGIGWDPDGINAPFDDPFTVVANYCNTGADIAAVGYGLGFGLHEFLVDAGDGTAGDPFIPTLADDYGLFLDNFGSVVAATYVAGAASMVFQTLSFVNGTTPTPAEVEAELMTTVQFSPLEGTDNSGLLNANAAMTSAINGGNLFDIVPALAFENILASQPFSAITRGTDFSLTVTVSNGTAPFEIEIDWGNGEAPEIIPNWNNGDPVTLEGGYDTLGPKIINVTVRDDANQTVITGVNTVDDGDSGIDVFVINPISAGITIERVDDGTVVLPSALQDGVDYRFRANVTNVFTGEIGGVPNTTTLSWDFDEDNTADATGPTVEFTYLIIETSRNFNVELTITEDVRPGGVFNLPVTVTGS